MWQLTIQLMGGVVHVPLYLSVYTGVCMDEGECMHVHVCVRAGVSVSVSMSVYRGEGGCVLAEMDTSAFNGAAGQLSRNVDAPIYVCRATMGIVVSVR